MNRREVKNQINRRGENRTVALCHWYAKETESLYAAEIEGIKEHYPDDVLLTEFQAGHEKFADYPYWYGGLDEFGCIWHKSTNSVGAHISNQPLESWLFLDEYLSKQLPDLSRDTQDRFAETKKLRKLFPDKYLVGKAFRCFWERFYMIRGMENAFIDFYDNPEMVNKCLYSLLHFNEQLIEGWAECDVDAVFLADDWGSQKQLFIQPDLWRSFFKEKYTILCQKIHSLGMDVWFHSCGNISLIIGDLIDCGIDVLHGVQPDALNLDEVSKKYKGQISFCGAIDVQNLAQKSITEITNEVNRVIELFQTPHGGYILAPSSTIMPETPFKNIVAFRESIISENERAPQNLL